MHTFFLLLRRTPLAVCAVLLMATVLHAAPTDQRTALVIGNSAYEVTRLKNPVNDATAMAQALRDTGFEVTVLTDATRKQMERAIRKLGKRLRDGGVGLFYYAGHGMQVNGVNYLIPVNAEIEEEFDIKFEAVDAGRVLAVMDTAGNRMNIIILDACRDNPYAHSFRSSASGLAKMDAPAGTLLAYATAPGATAMDGDGQNGLYTSHLLKAIRQPGLSIEEMFKKVRAGVLADSGERQTPWESSSLVGNFFFTPAEVHAAPVPQTPPPVQISSDEVEALRRQVEELRTLALQNTARPRQPQDNAEMAKLREQLEELRKLTLQKNESPKPQQKQNAQTEEELAALRRQLEDLRSIAAGQGATAHAFTMAVLPWAKRGLFSRSLAVNRDTYLQSAAPLLGDHGFKIVLSAYDISEFDAAKTDTTLLTDEEKATLWDGLVVVPASAAKICARLGVDALFTGSTEHLYTEGPNTWRLQLFDCRTGKAYVETPRSPVSMGYCNTQGPDQKTMLESTTKLLENFPRDGAGTDRPRPAGDASAADR